MKFSIPLLPPSFSSSGSKSISISPPKRLRVCPLHRGSLFLFLLLKFLDSDSLWSRHFRLVLFLIFALFSPHRHLIFLHPSTFLFSLPNHSSHPFIHQPKSSFTRVATILASSKSQVCIISISCSVTLYWACLARQSHRRVPVCQSSPIPSPSPTSPQLQRSPATTHTRSTPSGVLPSSTGWQWIIFSSVAESQQVDQ